MAGRKRVPKMSNTSELDKLVQLIRHSRQQEVLEILSTAIKLSNQSLKQLAKRANVSPTTISNIKTMVSVPNSRVTTSVAQVLLKEFSQL